MQVLGQIAGGAFTLVCFVVGLRLMGLSLRTRQLPELLVGAGLLFLAGLGYPLSAVAREAVGLPADVRGGIGLLAGVLAATGMTAQTAFTWVLFRRGQPWATALVAAVGAGAFGLVIAQSVAGGWTTGALFWGWLPFGISVAFGWSFIECGRYHGMLKRRLRLGLADPVVTDRFRLYALATGLAVVTNVVGQVYWFLDLEMLTDPLGSVLLAVLASSSSVLMWLAFLPPRRYCERVHARVAAA